MLRGVDSPLGNGVPMLLRVALLLTVLTGFSALVYEIAWADSHYCRGIRLGARY